MKSLKRKEVIKIKLAHILLASTAITTTSIAYAQTVDTATTVTINMDNTNTALIIANMGSSSITSDDKVYSMSS